MSEIPASARHTVQPVDDHDDEHDVDRLLVPVEYDPLTVLREVKRILDRQEHTKRGLREQRTQAILAMAGPLGWHDAIERSLAYRLEKAEER